MSALHSQFADVEDLTHRTRFGDIDCRAAATQAMITVGGHRIYINAEEAAVIRDWLNRAIPSASSAGAER